LKYFFAIFFAICVQNVNAADKATISSITEVLEMVNSKYVQKINSDKITSGALNGILQSLDPYSAYLTPEDYKEMQMQTSGSFFGVGIEMIKDGAFMKVITPLDGSPALRAGVKAGDLIASINGVPAAELSLHEAANMMRGEIGAIVKLKILRTGAKSVLNIAMKREKIVIRPVKTINKMGTPVIKISSFTQQTYTDVVTAVQILMQKREIEQAGGLIIDLRNNPGGLLEQAVDISNLFLNSYAKIVTIRAKGEQKVAEFVSSDPDIIKGVPIVILINKGTASASEIVASALRDNRRALIVGETSFGKGVVQDIFELNAIAGAAVKLTTAMYYTPNGTKIQDVGITPDIQSTEKTSDDDLLDLPISTADQVKKDKLYTEYDDSFIKAVQLLKNPVEYKRLLEMQAGGGEELLGKIEGNLQ
jgi:carboxyl-terminal processing protease